MKLRPSLAGVLLMWLVSPACRNVDSDLPRAYRSAPVPDNLASAGTVGRGGALFHRVLHALPRRAGRRTWPPKRRPDAAAWDLTDPGWREGTSPRHVFFAIREGVRGTAMPSWKSLSESDAWDLTAYVLSLSARQSPTDR